jgi:hypothetical protein
VTGTILLLAWAVLVASVTLLLIGWRRATALYRDLLLVRERQGPPGVWVRALGARTITLEAPAPRQDIGHPGVSGLSWAGGYGQVTEVEAVVELRVTRGFRLIQGSPPPVCPDTPPDDCPEVDLDPWAYPFNPGDVGLEFEETSYRSPLGALGGWLVPADRSDGWAIHVHGWTASRREALRFLPVIHANGLTSLVIDYRNDAGAPAEPSGLYRFGLTEWADVEGAVRHAQERGAGDIVLVGYSTGAAHVMSFLERSDLRQAVSGVVLDSPNVILAETVRLDFSGSSWLGVLTSELGMWIADRRWRIDWERTNYVARAEGILTMPTLVFHGTSDHQVPISVSRQLEARAPTVTLVETQAAGHVMSWNADPARYERHLKRFLGGLSRPD